MCVCVISFTGEIMKYSIDANTDEFLIQNDWSFAGIEWLSCPFILAVEEKIETAKICYIYNIFLHIYIYIYIYYSEQCCKKTSI